MRFRAVLVGATHHGDIVVRHVTLEDIAERIDAKGTVDPLRADRFIDTCEDRKFHT